MTTDNKEFDCPENPMPDVDYDESEEPEWDVDELTRRFPLGNLPESAKLKDDFFSDAFPPHGNGGHLARAWERYSALTIQECVCLSFGMNPLADQSTFWKDAGTLHLGMFNSRAEEIVRAVQAGIIRKIGEDKEISSETLVIAEDVKKYLMPQTKRITTEKQEKPLETRQRRTLLTIIAALCKHAGIDPQVRGAAQRIKQMTETLGTPIDDETIKKALDGIPDALETRMK